MIARYPHHGSQRLLTDSVNCPACLTPAPVDFLEVPVAPVTCTSIFPTEAAAREIPSGRIDLCVCKRCGFVFNRSFDARLGEVGARYESSQAASAHFSAFARSLAAEWVSRHGLRDRLVVEVGSGSGHFLREMIESGVARVWGVDPLATESTDPRINVVQACFDPEQHDFAAAALVCRHTLEHVPDVAGFLGRVRAWAVAAPDRVVLFEIPDAERVFSERAFWDVYYEHCNYFTVATTSAAFERAGFVVERICKAYDDQYLLVEARADMRHGERGEADVADVLLTCQSFAHDVYASVRRCGDSLRSMGARSPVAIWQGAAKTVGLLTFLGEGFPIACAVDLSPQRHGRYLPGTGLPVVAPEALKHILPDNIVLMNPVYLDEVRACVRELGIPSHVHSINDLLR